MITFFNHYDTQRLDQNPLPHESFREVHLTKDNKLYIKTHKSN
jgi:hypothetical protein